MSNITLYFAPMSSASPVGWAIQELGVDHELVSIDLKGDAHKQARFLELNPMGQVPTLVVDGQAMFESSACVILLGERFGVARGLWPALEAPEHMVALTWMVWFAVTLGGEVRRCFHSGDYAPEAMRNAPQVAAGKKRYGELLEILDAHLEGRDFMLGERFSLVDCYGGASVWWSARALGVEAPPRVAAWCSRCTGRPASSIMG
ncbi:MAG: glutathione S-transferase family protein [Myxococcales bacterium]|nr:glutathione S-transferase family protein [Myxococcales bacterium]